MGVCLVDILIQQRLFLADTKIIFKSFYVLPTDFKSFAVEIMSLYLSYKKTSLAPY